MTAVPKRRLYTYEEYLELEEKSFEKHEFLDGVIYPLYRDTVMMAGASSAHVKISGNLYRKIGNALEGKPCYPLQNDMLVKVSATGFTAYPDVIVVCEPEEYESKKERILLNPTVLIEVSSTTTERHDRTEKLQQYKRISSLQEYVLVAQDRPDIEVFTRHPVGWTHRLVHGLEEEFKFESLGISIAMAAIYERVIFPHQPTLFQPEADPDADDS